MKKTIITILIIMLAVLIGATSYIFIYKGKDTVETPTEERIYYSKDITFSMYDNFTYVDVDIDNDGNDDLIVKQGTDEASYSYFIYQGNGKGYTLISSIGAGHTTLYKEDNTDYVTMLYGNMGNEIVTQIKIENNTLVNVETKNITLSANQEYDTFDGELTFMEKN